MGASRPNGLLLAGCFGLTLTFAASLAMAAAGPALVPAAGWVAERGGAVPGWLLGPFGDGLELDGARFYVLLWTSLAGFLLTLVAAPVLGRGPIWATVAASIGVLTLAPPLLSQDVFSYIAYARMGADYGLNPYESAPAAIATDPVMSFVGWPDAVSVYGPVFTLASYAIGPLSLPASLWAMKVTMSVAVIATAALTERLARQRGVDPNRALVFVALNPLVLAHVVGGAHNDALMALALTVAVALLLSAREAGGGAVLVLAAATKLSALFVAPFALLGRLRRRRLLAGAVGAALAVGAVALASFGDAALESLRLVDDNQSVTSRYSVPATLSRAIAVDVDLVRAVMTAGFALSIAWLAYRTWRGADWVRTAAWAGLATLVVTGWLLPWYVIWVLPLAAISRDRVLCGLVIALTAFQLISRVPL